MSKADILRVIVTDRMTIAVREILAVVETTVAGYENEVLLLKRELDRHKRQLDSILQPEVNLYRIDVVGAPDILLSDSTNGNVNELKHQRSEKQTSMTDQPQNKAREKRVDGELMKVSHEETLLEHEESDCTLGEAPSDSSVSCQVTREDNLRDNPIIEVQNTKAIRRSQLANHNQRCYRSNPNVTETDSDDNGIETNRKTKWKSSKNKRLKEKQKYKLLITELKNANAKTTECGNSPTTSVLEEEQLSEMGGTSKTTDEHENMSSMDESEDCEDDHDWKPVKNNKDEKQCPAPKKKIKKKKMSSEDPDSCKVCGYLFKSKTMLTKHALSHLDHPKGICGVCGQHLESSEELKSHLETHQKLHICDTCGRIFRTLVAFQRHIVRCQDVESASANETLLKKNNYDCQDKPFKCDSCSQSFRFKAQLHVHHKKHSGEKPFCCDVCGKSLTSYRNFCQHKLIHTGEKNYSCKQCGKLFSSTKFLKTHEKIHSVRERNFLCEICSKAFYTKNELGIHQKRHEEKYIKCPVCGKLLKGNLETHMGVHTGIKPFSCKECGMKFRLRSHLKSHMETHLGIKPHLCTVCGHTFGRKEHLDLHMRTHTGLKPYKCALCDKAFTQSHCLKTHMKSHQTEEQSAAGSLSE